MAAIPDQLAAMIDRLYAKGTILQYGVTKTYGSVPTQWTSFAGVTKINGPDLKRTGPVDCTELAPQAAYETAGVFPADSGAGEGFGTMQIINGLRTAETYFNTQNALGTKDAQPLGLSINTSKAMAFSLNHWFRYDTYLWWRILLRLQTDGTRPGFYFFGGIEELPFSFEENKLVSVELSLRPFGAINYVPDTAGISTITLPTPNSAG